MPFQHTMTIRKAIDIGLKHHQDGDLSKAEAIYKQILQAAPNQSTALHLLGVIAHQVEKNDIAIDLIEKALAVDPNYAEAHNNLGIVLQKQGKLEGAVTSYKKALSINADYVEAHSNLGNTLRAQGDPDNAAISYQKALTIDPDYAEAHYNLGNLFNDQKKLDDAVASYHKALAIKPDHAEAYNNLGNVLTLQGKLDAAVASYGKAIGLKPSYEVAHNNLGIVLQQQGDVDDAVTSYRKALLIKPDYVDAHINLGYSLRTQGKLDEAFASYKKAIAIKPDYAAPHYHIGTMLERAGSIDEALEEFDTAISLSPEKEGWLIRKALSLPVIVPSLEDIKIIRTNLIDAVQELQDRGVSVADPYLDINVTNFDLAYHSEDNKGIVENVARLHISACPKLTYEAKHCNSAYTRKPGRVRIGFLSSNLRDHTIGKLYKGIIEHISKDQFEVTFFKFATRANKITEAIEKAANKVVPLYKNLDRDRDIISAEELDILFYPDIGMDPYTYFLSFARLAPVQAVSWGHPDTTGIPDMDYFISSDLLEQRGTSDQYTEQLIQLSTLPTYYYRPKPPQETYTHSDFGLPKGCPLYVCPQTLFKLHPSFDALIGQILRQDKRGRLVLVGDGIYKNREKLILKRYERLYPDVIERVLFVPFMPSDKYLTLLRLADVILDVPSFSGGNSSLEAFAMGAPIVTCPGNFMRGRVTAGFYKMMGLDDLIAADEGEYVSLALKLAHDADFKCRMQADINSNSGKLFERIEVVREMETFFLEAHKSSQKGEILTNTEFRNILDSGSG